MRSFRSTPLWTLDSAHLEERDGGRGHRDRPWTPSDPAPPRGRGRGARSGMQRRLSGAASRAELMRGLRGCRGRGWGGAGRRGGAGAGKVGEDGLHGEGIPQGGDDAHAATTAGTGEDIEVEHAAYQHRPSPGARGDGDAGAGIECLRVRVGRWAAVADGLPAPAGMWGEDAVIQNQGGRG